MMYEIVVGEYVCHWTVQLHTSTINIAAFNSNLPLPLTLGLSLTFHGCFARGNLALRLEPGSPTMWWLVVVGCDNHVTWLQRSSP